MNSRISFYGRVAGPAGSASRVVVTLSFIMLIYLIVGVVFYNINQDLGIRDSIYFIMVTTLAVGFGDIYPKGPWDKSFTMIYALLGLGVMLVCLRRLIQILAHERSILLKKRKENKLLKTDNRLKSMLGIGSQKKSLLFGRLSEKQSKQGIDPGEQKSTTTGDTVSAANGQEVQHRSCLEKLCNIRRRAIARYPRFYRGTEIVVGLWAYICAVAAWLTQLRVLYPHQEFNGCIYFTIITGLTIGYGDVVPQTDARWFMIFWIPINTFAFSKALFMFDDAMRLHLDEDEDDDPARISGVTAQDMINAAEGANGGKMTEADYLRFMLTSSGMCSKELMDEFARRYAELDQHFGGGGGLSSQALRDSLERASQSDPSRESEVALIPAIADDGVSRIQMNVF